MKLHNFVFKQLNSKNLLKNTEFVEKKCIMRNLCFSSSNDLTFVKFECSS